MVQLNLATEGDVDTVLMILEENERWMVKQGIDQWPLYWHRRRRQEIESWAKSDCLYLARQGTVVLGTVALFEKDEKYWGNREEVALYFYKLAIRRDYSGKEIGEKVIACICDVARSRDIRFVRFSCLKKNRKLNEYYRRLGFVYAGVAAVDGFEDNLYELQLSRG